MKWIADTTLPRIMHFEIVHDVAAGYYLYVWEDGQGIRDDLQDTLHCSMTIAFEDYGVPFASWEKVTEC